MISPEQYEQLVDYLKGNLAEPERKRFESMLKEDEELQEELEWEILLLQKEDIFAGISEIVEPKTISEPLPARPVKAILFYLPLLAAVFTGFILLGLTSLLVTRPARDNGLVNNKPDTKLPADTGDVKQPQLPAPAFDYLLAYNEVHTKFNSDIDLPEQLANVQIAYADSDYRRVLSEAAAISPVRGEAVPATESSYAGFYKGLAFLELNENVKAISQFNAALKTLPDQKLRKDILWYKALALLKQNRIAECRQILLQLAANKSTNKKVRRLLDKLPENATAR